MTKEVKSIDVSGMPELLRLAEEVGESGESRLLKRASENLAMIVPARTRASKRPALPRKKSAREAFLASAGSWKGLVDTDRLVADIYDSRRRSSRPPVEL